MPLGGYRGAGGCLLDRSDYAQKLVAATNYLANTGQRCPKLT